MHIALLAVCFVLGVIMLWLGLRQRKRPLIAVGVVVMLVTGLLLLILHILGFY
jgi:drug/metabolite transporter superfamily protein YnfA